MTRDFEFIKILKNTECLIGSNSNFSTRVKGYFNNNKKEVQDC